MELYSFIEFVQRTLLISKPVELKMVSKVKKPNHKAAAFCDTRLRKGKIIKHVLVFNTFQMESSEYNYLNIIAHELVHASMIENGLFNPQNHHCKLFAKLSKKLEKTLRELKYDIGATPIYNPQTDTAG